MKVFKSVLVISVCTCLLLACTDKGTHGEGGGQKCFDFQIDRVGGCSTNGVCGYRAFSWEAKRYITSTKGWPVVGEVVKRCIED